MQTRLMAKAHCGSKPLCFSAFSRQLFLCSGCIRLLKCIKWKSSKRGSRLSGFGEVMLFIHREVMVFFTVAVTLWPPMGAVRRACAARTAERKNREERNLQTLHLVHRYISIACVWWCRCVIHSSHSSLSSVFHWKRTVWWGHSVLPLHGNASGCNVASRSPLSLHTLMRACLARRQGAGARAPLWSIYFDLHVCFMSVENAFRLASFPPSNGKSGSTW